MLAKDVGILLEVFFGGADHLHPLQNHHVGVLLDQRPNHSPVPKVLVEVDQPALLKQHFSYRLLTPEEQDVL